MTNNVCSECGQMLAEDAKFCSGCGRPLSGEAAPSIGGGSWLRDGLIIVVVLAAAAGVYFVSRDTPEPVVAAPPDHEDMGAALSNLPADYAGLIASGNRQMDDGNYPMAAELYRRALEIDGSSPDVRTDFGACLHAMGLPDRALDEFRTVYDEHPEHTIVRFNMGIVHYGAGRFDSARIYWEEFLSLNPQGEAAASAREFLEQIGN